MCRQKREKEKGLTGSTPTKDVELQRDDKAGKRGPRKITGRGKAGNKNQGPKSFPSRRIKRVVPRQTLKNSKVAQKKKAWNV